MDKSKLWRTAIELGKDILILVLACTALWMIGGENLLRQVAGPQRERPAVTQQQTDPVGAPQGARPMSIVVNLRSEGEVERRAVQHDDQELDRVFRSLSALLMETLSSAEGPREVERREWEEALGRAPGFCLDYQGEMPLSALSTYLSGKGDLPEGLARRVLLTGLGEEVALYWQEAGTGRLFRCTTQVVTTHQLENAVEGLSPNGAYYAFESELTAGMDPDTLLTPSPEPMPRYLAANPATGGRTALEGLMTDLGISLAGCVFYPAADEEVVRMGSDTMRLSTRGVLEYHADEDGPQQFPVTSLPGGSAVFSAIESCRALLEQAAGQRCGQARLYLSGVTAIEGGWRLDFSYRLNGVEVALEEGSAASFTVRRNQITAFTLRLRSYEQGEEEQLILPPAQAAAAMSALSLEGRELRLMYRDRGEEMVSPNWVAAAEQVG